VIRKSWEAGLLSKGLKVLNEKENLTLAEYLTILMEEKGIEKREAIRKSTLEPHYAYQILSGKRIPSREKVLALCLGAELSLKEIDRALRRAGYSPLYPKNPRDARIIIAVNNGNYSIMAINEILQEAGEKVINAE